jgi:putative pyrimidine permease RutG
MLTLGLFPDWKLKSRGVILPEERLPAGQTVIVGLQHFVAKFSATVLAPIVMGFDPNVVVLSSGIGTLIFFVAVGGRVPSYLGSSASFITVVVAATAYVGPGANPNLGVALGGIITAGLVFTLIGIAVVLAGHEWLEKLMPPVVAGSVVAVVALDLAPIAVRDASGGLFKTVMAIVTVATIGAVAVFTKGFSQRIPILIGGAVAWLLYWVLANGLQLGAPIDFDQIANTAWFGVPKFSAPVFAPKAIATLAPIAIVLVAENLGHLKVLSALIGRNLDAYLGRAFIGDGIATMVSAAFGGTAMTTYAQNIGLMGLTRVYSTLVFVVAAMFAIILGFSPKLDAVLQSIPGPVHGGLSIIVSGLIATAAIRIWVENNVDFSKATNAIIIGASIIAGAGGLTLNFGGFSLGGIGTAMLVAIILHQLLRDRTETVAGEKNLNTWAIPSEISRAAGYSMAEEAAASIIHEVKQPLAAINTNANAAVRWLERIPPELDEARTALTSIVSVVHRANEVIEGIRAVFKRDKLQLIALDVNTLILEVLRILDDELQIRQITVQTELINTQRVLADRVQLQQVFLNLIMNAIEAMNAVDGRPRILRIESEIYGREAVVVAVSDSGSGIDPKDLGRIFNAFFTTKARGMGMGLSICRSIVEAHGGRLWASRGAPHGSIFHVVLQRFNAGIGP